MLSKLKGKTKFETFENYSIGGIVFGVALLTIGIGMTVLNPKGLSAILSMIGALISFISTVLLIGVWVVNEFLN